MSYRDGRNCTVRVLGDPAREFLPGGFVDQSDVQSTCKDGEVRVFGAKRGDRGGGVRLDEKISVRTAA